MGMSSGAVAKGRQGDGHDVEPIEQILAERSLLDHLADITAGGGENAHIDLVVLVTADGREGQRLQNAKELGLQTQLEIADLVDEERSAIGLLESSDAAVGGAGECAADMPEQFAFNQGSWERRRS